jgi:hypothetical protein
VYSESRLRQTKQDIDLKVRSTNAPAKSKGEMEDFSFMLRIFWSEIVSGNAECVIIVREVVAFGAFAESDLDLIYIKF